MAKELRVSVEHIKTEMETLVIPYAANAGLNMIETLEISVRYAAERSKDWEWESNERAMEIIKNLIDLMNTPIIKFQRKYGRLCLN